MRGSLQESAEEEKLGQLTGDAGADILLGLRHQSHEGDRCHPFLAGKMRCGST
jgi:hypothetical protein